MNMGRTLLFLFVLLFTAFPISAPAQSINEDADVLVAAVAKLHATPKFDATNIETDLAIQNFALDHEIRMEAAVRWFIAPALERYLAREIRNETPESGEAVWTNIQHRSPGLRRLFGYITAYHPPPRIVLNVFEDKRGQ